MTRDRVQTENRLIDAIHELLSAEDFSQIKINRVAQHAKVNKILIYRYFGGIDGLISAYYEKYKPVINHPPIDIERLRGIPLEEFFRTCCDYVLSEFRQLRSSPQAQSFLKNDLLSYQPGVFNPFVSEKEKQIRTIIDELSGLVQTNHGRSFSAIILSGMTMLTFMAQDKRTIFGIDLSTEEGWIEVERALQHIYQAIAETNKGRIDTTVSMSDSPPPVE